MAERMRVLLRIIAVLVLVTGAAAGGTYQQVYMQQIPGAENVDVIDPVLDGSGQLAGFVFLDTDNWQVEIVRFSSADTTRIITSEPPRASVNYLGPGDTLSVYILTAVDAVDWDFEYGPTLLRMRQADGWSDQTTRSTRLYNSPGVDQWTEWETHGWRLAIPLDRQGCRMGVSLGFWGMLTVPSLMLGTHYSTICVNRVYNFGLDTALTKTGDNWFAFGDLAGDSLWEGIGVKDYVSGYSDWEHPEDNSHSEWSAVAQYNHQGQTEYAQVMAKCSSAGLFCGDFVPGQLKDEIIYVEAGPDITGEHPEVVRHLACYNFSSGSPVELWYRPEPRMRPALVLGQSNLLVGGRLARETVFLDCRDGSLVDSITIDRTLGATKYFETGTDQHSLCLAGRVADTIFVYRFDEITDVGDPTAPARLPDGFDLYANYPNPFNPQTEIAFELARTGEVRLEVFNLLGQLVATPVARRLAAGEHRVTWRAEGKTGEPLASGVYLYRLTVDGRTRSGKMTLVR